MKSKRRKFIKENWKKVRSILEYSLMRLAILLLRLFPEKLVRSAVARLFSLFQIRREVAYKNLEFIFPQMKEEEKKQIIDAMYYNFGLTAVESYITPSRQVFSQMSLEGFELVEKALLRGKGVFIASGHLGNFEMAGRMMAADNPLAVIIKRQHNPYFDRYSNKQREADGCTLITAGGALRPIRKMLRKNGLVVVMTDQNARHQGYQLDFLGKPASTHITVAKLAIKYDVPVITAGVIRNEKGYPLLKFSDFLDPQNYEDSDEGYVKLMQKILFLFGEMVKKYPSHWFWVHRRWRNPEKGRLLVND